MSILGVGTILAAILSVAICFIVAVAIIIVIIKLISDKKKGKTQCGGDCYGCAYNGSCHEKPKS